MVYTKLELWKLKCEIAVQLAEDNLETAMDFRHLFFESIIRQWKEKGRLSKKQLHKTLALLNGGVFYRYCERNYREGTPEALYNIKALNAAVKDLPDDKRAHYIVGNWYKDRNDPIWAQYTGTELYKNL